ncbi:hypothetical protein ALC56_07058, partial [Trachymyrmex septentrionalis]
ISIYDIYRDLKFWPGHRFAVLKMNAFIASLIYNFYLEPINHLKNLRLQANIIILSYSNSYMICSCQQN